jgi:glycosyltransferase involved in cell wall biosynthesis
LSDPKIVAMYRIRNEARWIEKSLEQTSKICQEIVILDDCSTDNTVEICKKFSNVVEIHERKKQLPLDEVRDRNIILELALKLNPDYILIIDGDEVLMNNSKEILYEELSVLYPEAKIVYLQILDVWDKSNQIRIDGLYGKTWRPSLLKIDKTLPPLKFIPTKYPGNLHCYDKVIEQIDENYLYYSNVKILHFSNFDQKIRQKKFEYYNKIDPNSIEQDGYKHVISGQGKHSGVDGIELIQLPDYMT